MKTLRERREDALHNFRNNSNSTQQKELLTFLLFTASQKQIKEAIDHFGIKVEKNK